MNTIRAMESLLSQIEFVADYISAQDLVDDPRDFAIMYVKLFGLMDCTEEISKRISYNREVHNYLTEFHSTKFQHIKP
jgi:hypothetical protein